MSSEAPLSAIGEDILRQLYVVLESANAISGEDVSGSVNQIADQEQGELMVTL